MGGLRNGLTTGTAPGFYCPFLDFAPVPDKSSLKRRHGFREVSMSFPNCVYRLRMTEAHAFCNLVGSH
jgi:hypothetical protein